VQGKDSARSLVCARGGGDGGGGGTPHALPPTHHGLTQVCGSGLGPLCAHPSLRAHHRDTHFRPLSPTSSPTSLGNVRCVASGYAASTYEPSVQGIEYGSPQQSMNEFRIEFSKALTCGNRVLYLIRLIRLDRSVFYTV